MNTPTINDRLDAIEAQIDEMNSNLDKLLNELIIKETKDVK